MKLTEEDSINISRVSETGRRRFDEKPFVVLLVVVVVVSRVFVMAMSVLLLAMSVLLLPRQTQTM
jgi:hypothetical protein